MSTVINDRALHALHARRDGWSLRQIAGLYGCSVERARQLCVQGEQLERALQIPDIWNELSNVVRNSLRRDGCEPSIDAVLKNYHSLSELHRIPAMGRKRIAELQRWLVKHGKGPI